LRKCFIEVIHLREDADDHHNHEHVSRVISKLVVSSKSEFERNTECLDRHDGYAAHGAADRNVDEWVLATVLWRDFVNHNDGEYDDEEAIEHESYIAQVSSHLQSIRRGSTYLGA
jgi:hypothetical protein